MVYHFSLHFIVLLFYCFASHFLVSFRVKLMCEKMQLVKNLGSRTPIILSFVHGVMGRDALTDEFREV